MNTPRTLHAALVFSMATFAGCDLVSPQEPGGDGVVIIDDVPFVTSLDDADARLDAVEFIQTLDDLDGDGLHELVTRNDDDRATTHLYLDLDADPLVITTTADVLTAPTFASRDVNGDGANDLLVLSPKALHEGAEHAIAQNQGAVLVFHGPIAPGRALDEASADQKLDLTGYIAGVDGKILVDDLDGDGALDLVVAGGAIAYTYSGAFAEGATEARRQGRIGSGGVGWRSSALGDFDGDGQVDLAMVSASLGGNDANLAIFLGPLNLDAEAEGVEASDAVWQLGKVHWGAEDVLTNLGDGDGDGADALAVSAFEPIAGADDDTEYAGVVYVVDGVPEGAQPIWEGAQATYEGANPGDEVGKFISAGDVDGDGHVDLIVTNSRNDGGLLYGPATPRPVYVVHGPHEGTSSLADADDTIWEASTSDYVDIGGVVAGHFTRRAAADLVLCSAGQAAAFHFER